MELFCQAFAGLLAAAMLITSSGLESVVAYAAEDSSVSESESSETEQRTVTLGNFENGTLAFSDSNKSSKDYAVGETVTVYATPRSFHTSPSMYSQRHAGRHDGRGGAFLSYRANFPAR